VRALVDRCRKLRDENVRFARELGERDQRVTDLEAQLRQANQLRRDVAKRIDDLVGQIDHLEAQFTAKAD
jgi:septal ring factor EnvC (AmiA/AmiB activator)